LEGQICALSESSLLVSDSSSDFRGVEQRAADIAEFEQSSSNCDTAVEMKHLRSDEAASRNLKEWKRPTSLSPTGW